MKTTTDHTTKIILALTLLIYLLFGLASLLPLEAFWGLNHISFLPFGSSLIFYLGLIALVLILAVSPPEKFIAQIEVQLTKTVSNFKLRIIIALLFSLLFYAFKMETHFLGDGYSWLSLLGYGKTSFHKFAEPGSIYLVKYIQELLGGYTKATAQVTFQMLSVISGGIVIYCLLDIIKRLEKAGVSALLSLVTLLFSGHMLLYFGYIEFYPISWAANLVFINLSLRYLQLKKGLLWVISVYLISMAAHIQALYFLPALGYLITIRFESPILRKIGYIVIGLGAVTGASVFIWLYRTNLTFELLILPFFSGRPPAIDYTVFSFRHLFDIINLILLVFPGIIILAPLLFTKLNKELETTKLFLILMTTGSLSFLIVYGAAITMAIDWDIFSLTLLPLVLLLLYVSRNFKKQFNGRFLFTYLVVCLIISGSYLSANLNTTASELRFKTLLNDNHRSSWVMYADYFRRIGNQQKYEAVISEMNNKFPDYLTLSRTYQLLSEKKYDEAFSTVEKLYQKNKYNADFSQMLGNIYGKKQMYDSAEYYYQRAITLKPYNTGIQNELGQLYTREGKYDESLAILKKAKGLTPQMTAITESMAVNYLRQNQLDSAKVLADELFEGNPDSPGGHLILLAVALHQGDEITATFHYNMFLKLGKGRSDYNSIFEFYNYLNQRHLK